MIVGGLVLIGVGVAAGGHLNAIDLGSGALQLYKAMLSSIAFGV